MSSSSNSFSQLKGFLSYLSTIKGDLSNITAPPFILSSKSVVEFPATWAEHHSIFLSQAANTSPQERALAVLKNFLCSLKSQQYTGRSESEGVKKPLNAFLGELFIAEFEGDDSTTRMISEQVSHHPPATACALFNEELGIHAEGYLAQETTFSPTSGVTVQQFGYAIIHTDKFHEDHLMTLPTLNVKGLLSGSLYPELTGTCYIVSSSGYISKIEFEGKSLLGDKKKNSLHAILFETNHEDKPLYEVSGQWNREFSIRDCRKEQEIELVKVDDLKSTPLKVIPIEKQDPWESRKAWWGVISALERRDMKAVTEEKNKIEEAQRHIRKTEKEQGKEWPRIFFVREESHPLAEQLLSSIDRGLNKDRTNGVWKFVGARAAETTQKPYHNSLTPLGQVE